MRIGCIFLQMEKAFYALVTNFSHFQPTLPLIMIRNCKIDTFFNKIMAIYVKINYKFDGNSWNVHA